GPRRLRVVRWGIIGAGAIARVFAKDLRTANAGELVAVGSRDVERARSFGAPRAHGSYEDLLADISVEAVYIATRHPEHAECVIAAAEAGKHALCEKPLAMNAGEAERAVDAAKVNSVFLMEAFMY